MLELGLHFLCVGSLAPRCAYLNAFGCFHRNGLHFSAEFLMSSLFVDVRKAAILCSTGAFFTLYKPVIHTF